mgnify:CR=1 FL=1
MVPAMLRACLVFAILLLFPGRWAAGAEEIAPVLGTWLSNWGLLTFTAAPEAGEGQVRGRLQQWPGQRGTITGGTYDAARRRLDLTTVQDWNGLTSTASLTLAPDGRTLTGTWRNARGTGPYTMRLMFRGAPPRADTHRPRSLPVAAKPRLEVVPVLFLARDATWVTPWDIDTYAALLARHVELAQHYYKAQLVTDTFKIADAPVVIHRGEKTDAEYLAALKPEHKGPGEAQMIARELLQARGEDRYSSNSVFLIVYVRARPREEGGGFHGGGRPFNGAPGTGGGSVELELEWLLNINSGFQQAVNHELGHAFGLVHPDAYGYDQKNNGSIMSYDDKIGTKGFEPAKGRFNPEEFAALGRNRRAFPDFRYDPALHNPTGKAFTLKTLPCMTDHIGQRRGFRPNSCMVWPCPCPP